MGRIKLNMNTSITAVYDLNQNRKFDKLNLNRGLNYGAYPISGI